MRATAITHFGSELIAVGILVAVGAKAILHMQIEAWMCVSVAPAATRRFVTTFERERRLAMHLNAERCRLKPMLGVASTTLAAVSTCKLAAVGILVATVAAIELQTAISPVLRDPRIVAACACNFFMLAAQRKWS